MVVCMRVCGWLIGLLPLFIGEYVQLRGEEVGGREGEGREGEVE